MHGDHGFCTTREPSPWQNPCQKAIPGDCRLAGRAKRERSHSWAIPTVQRVLRHPTEPPGEQHCIGPFMLCPGTHTWLTPSTEVRWQPHLLRGDLFTPKIVW